ncbi:hypothetical protein EAF00_000401 [Botryotinia globosa]|nr:hypothetical protein EAF00_000401 [Botryotinia globosa]
MQAGTGKPHAGPRKSPRSFEVSSDDPRASRRDTAEKMFRRTTNPIRTPKVNDQRKLKIVKSQPEISKKLPTAISSRERVLKPRKIFDSGFDKFSVSTQFTFLQSEIDLYTSDEIAQHRSGTSLHHNLPVLLTEQEEFLATFPLSSYSHGSAKPSNPQTDWEHHQNTSNHSRPEELKHESSHYFRKGGGRSSGIGLFSISSSGGGSSTTLGNDDDTSPSTGKA